MAWHVFTVRIDEKPGGWRVHSHREVGAFDGPEQMAGHGFLPVLVKHGYLGSTHVYSRDEVGPGQIGVYVLISNADVPKLAKRQVLVMGIGNGPSGADWPMLALEWTP